MRAVNFIITCAEKHKRLLTSQSVLPSLLNTYDMARAKQVEEHRKGCLFFSLTANRVKKESQNNALLFVEDKLFDVDCLFVISIKTHTIQSNQFKSQGPSH